jgi:hypothetical protein
MQQDEMRPKIVILSLDLLQICWLASEIKHVNC